MNELASYFKFQELCDVLEAISAAKKPKEKKDILSKFIQQFKSKAVKLQPEISNSSFFPILRLILPHLERDRGPFGIKEFSFAKKLINMLSLKPDGPEASCLLNYQGHFKNVNIKDFADAAFWILKKYYYKSSSLTILDINNGLDMLAQLHSSAEPRKFDETLFKLFRATSAKEQKWLIRIILKDMKLGIGQDSILNTFHPDAVEFYASNSSLTKVCGTLKDSSIRLNEIEIEIFTAFRVMLSKRCDVNELVKISSSPNMLYYVETKFDGERFQLHMKDNTFKYFSRRGFDYTATFGDSFDNGLFTPLLKNCFVSNVNSIILDGEMMGWNTKTQRFGSKGMNFDVKNLTESTTHQPCFCVFDILLINDQVLTNKPLKQRTKILYENLKPIEGVIMLSKIGKATSQADLVNALNTSMDNEEEGIVIKDPNSVYKMNDRNSGWWKVKLEYFEDVMSDLDVIILGGFYGSGRHRLNIRIFLVGIGMSASGKPPKRFLAFARIQTGLSDEEYSVLDKKLGPFWRKMGDDNPSNYGIKFGKDKPDVWIPPEHSCVLLVRGSELIKTSDFPSKYTLRFPRILSIRNDKAYYDCLNDQELEDLTIGSKHVEKLNKRHLELDDLQIMTKKRRKVILKAKNLKDIEVKRNILDGYEFRVLTGNKEFSKDTIEKLIIENGGNVVQNEGNKTFCLVAGYNDPRIQFYQEKGHFCDVAKLEWLLEVINSGRFKMYGPFDLLSFTHKTRLQFLREYDQYFDSYTQEATEESIRKSVQLIKKKGHYINLMPNEVAELLRDLENATN
ncbi:DNA ligase 4 [Agrilus planipennis]|uniref:DNA ligase 4 n=1 Tax=Agrilus planipennis TaxID=224129 RepID=A0A1W4WPW1_AGRPL|nr:DNA ligase 4 [Agrilus planipennis]